MFEQVAIKNAIYRISLTDASDTIHCIICNESEIIDFLFSKKNKRAFIKGFEKKHIDKYRKGIIK